MLIRLKDFFALKIVNLIKKYFKENFKYHFDLEEKQKNININSKLCKTVKLYDYYTIRNSDIGDYTYISNNSVVNNTKIGKFCSIGPNFISGWGMHPLDKISTSPMFYSTKKQNGFTLVDEDKYVEMKEILIGNDVYIGMNVMILDGVTIGDGAVIGAGAVVSKDIPPYAIAVGVPIKILKYRFPEEVIQKLLKIKWWDWERNDLQKVVENFENVEDFTKKYD